MAAPNREVPAGFAVPKRLPVAGCAWAPKSDEVVAVVAAGKVGAEVAAEKWLTIYG